MVDRPRPVVAELTARLRDRVERLATSRTPITGFAIVVAVGLACLVAAMVPAGPSSLDGVGAVIVAAAYSWALAARTGGRPVVFGSLAIAVGVAALVSDADMLRTGAAVMTCVIAAVLGVMATIPAVTFTHAARECVIALTVAVIGALATIGFEPAITVTRFEYATFGLALAAAFVVVYRLGAGLHGLGRRGVVIVIIGGVVLVVTLLYAELLRRYGESGLVSSLLDFVRWSRDNVGAFPRPIEAVLGVPALAYGCHMRARRRQGWWVCAFGVAATSAAANALANPEIAFTEAGLSLLYGLVIGLGIGFIVIRLDVFLTGGSAGHAGAAAASPMRPTRCDPSRRAPPRCSERRTS